MILVCCSITILRCWLWQSWCRLQITHHTKTSYTSCVAPKIRRFKNGVLQSNHSTLHFFLVGTTVHTADVRPVRCILGNGTPWGIPTQIPMSQSTWPKIHVNERLKLNTEHAYIFRQLPEPVPVHWMWKQCSTTVRHEYIHSWQKPDGNFPLWAHR